MEVKRFTGGEMDALPRNPYNYKITRCHLSFTTEFKELFWKHYNEGITPKDIRFLAFPAPWCRKMSVSSPWCSLSTHPSSE